MRLIFLLLAIGLSAAPPRAAAFDYKDVVTKARTLAARLYSPPAPIPQFMHDLSFTQYQGIRFKPEMSLWRGRARFNVMLVSPGYYYTHAVNINTVDAGGVHPVAYRKDAFTFSPDDDALAARIPPDLGYAGFKLTYPLHGPDIQNQFLVFAGASYFRGVGKDDSFGISARGLAVDTGLPSGEEFPSFIEYWLVQPGPDDTSMTVYALLDGESLTGAYAFQIHPGPATTIDVTATLFQRRQVQLLGIAPLTSMFYYGENTPRPTYEWRPQVHDSDGLLLHDGATGEWLWRPLINPRQLEMDYLQTARVDGFGLLQRHTAFSDYEDWGAHYERRPSTWVQAGGDWGKGSIVLVQIPAAQEISDNIVAFWAPAEPPPTGQPLTFTYRLGFGDPSVAAEPMGYAVHTFVGDGSVIGGGEAPGAYRIIVDFQGGTLDRLPGDAPVRGVVTPQDGGTVIEQFVQYMPAVHRWRLSILARPQGGKSLNLRAFLQSGGAALTETWTYRLPPGNAIGKPP